MLGDGCLAKHGRHHRLHVKHKAAQRALAEFKRQAFSDFVTMPLHEFDQQLRGRGFPAVQFASRTSPVFSEWHARFYEDRRKGVPKDIESLLTPLATAVWFMDDGAADFAGVTFQTHCFTGEEVRLLRGVMEQRYGLDVRVRANRGGEILYICAASMDDFTRLVEPFIIPELAYKLRPRRLVTP